jgi:2',3'-cyclic-nucleotide 2'-phosphodiesterase/3'-nucleotidase
MFKRHSRPASCLLTALLGCLWAWSLPAAERLVILQTADVHAHAAAWPRLATLIKAERAAAGADHVLLLDCGDTGQGTLAGARARGGADVAVLNALGYDAWVPGNHEFDYGAERFRELAGACRAAVLAAILAGERPPPNLRAWRLFERGGRRIAVVGMTSPYLDQWFMPPDLGGLRALALRQTLERVVPEVMAAKPDLIVLAVHHGQYTPARLGGDSLYFTIRDYPQVLLVLCAHSHETIPGARLGWHGWFVQPGQHGEFLARIEVDWPAAPGAAPLISSRLLPSAAADPDPDRKSTRLNSSHNPASRMPSSA